MPDTPENEELLNSILLNGLATYCVWGKEVDSGEHLYLQVYIELESRKTLTTMKKLFPKAHIKPRRGTQADAMVYSKKGGNYVEKGSKIAQGKRNDIMKLVNEIKVDKKVQ